MKLPSIGGAARTLVTVLSPLAAVGGGLAMAPLMTLGGALSLRFSLLAKAVRERPLWLLFLLGFIGWCAASSLWSPWPNHQQAPKLVVVALTGLLFAAGAMADASARRLTRAAMLAAFVVLAALITFEALTGMALNRAAQPTLPDGILERNPGRGVVVLMAMTWAVAGTLIAAGGPLRVNAARIGLLATALLSLQFHQLVSLAAFLAGLGAFAVAYMAPRFALIAATVGWAVWMLAAPFVTPIVFAQPGVIENIPLSWAARAGIWQYVCERIAEQPWIGHGLDASRAVTDRIEIRGLEMRGVPLHPHSGSLHIWFECGAVGAVLAAAALITGGLSLARKLKNDRIVAAAACATIGSLGVVFNVSFGAWQEWWGATLFFAAACVGAIGLRAARA